MILSVLLWGFLALTATMGPFARPHLVPDDGKLWVVLVAGSNGYYNYRHQADVCHAYQVVHRHGVPDENIIVMMYDDIANNRENPDKGVIINRPNGTNVYEGVPKDYTGNDVTPSNFLDLLMGKRVDAGSGKTLDSGPDDHVFVYFADHGAKGILGFPAGADPLKAADFVDALKAMHAAKRFKRLVAYVEACESGSMFKGLLPDNVDIYATTASNATTSSYACYYDDHLRTFLGDVYSVKWLEDSDKENIAKETLQHQYEVVKKETNTSTVCRFGDNSIGELAVGQFQGEKEATNNDELPPSFYTCGRDAVPAYEVPNVIMKKRIEESGTEEEMQHAQAEYSRFLANRAFVRTVNEKIIDGVTNGAGFTAEDELELTNFDCHGDVLDAYHSSCFSLTCNDYAMNRFNVFADLCETGFDKADIIAAIRDVCQNVDGTVCNIY